MCALLATAGCASWRSSRSPRSERRISSMTSSARRARNASRSDVEVATRCGPRDRGLGRPAARACRGASPIRSRAGQQRIYAGAGSGRAGRRAHVRLCHLGTTSDDAPDFVGVGEGPPTVLLLGRIDPRFPKGHDLLVSIWPRSFRRWRMRGWFSLAEAQRLPLCAILSPNPVAASIDVVGFRARSSHRRDLATRNGLDDAQRRGRFRLLLIEATAWRSCHRISR